MDIGRSLSIMAKVFVTILFDHFILRLVHEAGHVIAGQMLGCTAYTDTWMTQVYCKDLPDPNTGMMLVSISGGLLQLAIVLVLLMWDRLRDFIYGQLLLTTALFQFLSFTPTGDMTMFAKSLGWSTPIVPRPLYLLTYTVAYSIVIFYSIIEEG